MNKKIVLGVSLLAVAVLVSVSVVGAAPNKKATLINPDGHKVVVAVGSPAAQSYFGQGYALMTSPTNSCSCLGAISGTEVYQLMNFNSGFSRGGSRYATSSTAGTYTLTNTEMTNRANDVFYIDWTPNVSTTLTTQASSSMTWLNSVAGSSREFWFRNASTTAASSVTFAAGSGVDLQDNEDSADLALAGLDLMKLTFIRKANTDVLLVLDEYTEAD